MAKPARDKRATSPGQRGKGNLPSKPCAVCGRQFSWRKKWEKVWHEVRFCCERCRRASKSRPQG
ncbi:DUF2256 domain-containing protein [Henriciella aquimarina]|uniref:DUF2256 domain-containing protein n=1 Tax=Henriciella aquimarina TaxID=545261 RepID=UPI000A01D2AC|nr:DUF2256 domain-containing protein [Henriciella aquimarina]